MSMDKKSVDIRQEGKGPVRYCVECGAKIPRSQRICPACGETQA